MLIGSQGSKFKEAFVKKITDALQAEKIYAEVIDVTTLSTVNEEKWNAIILINSIQGGLYQKDLQIFTERVKNKDKIIILSTSGGATESKKAVVDTITSASKMNLVDAKAEIILNKLKTVLKK